MFKKKNSLTLQLFLGIVPFLFLLVIFIITRFNLINQDYINIISNLSYLILFIPIIFYLRPNEIKDELAKEIIAKIDGICIIFIQIVLVLLFSFTVSPYFKAIPFDRDDFGLMISLILVSIATLKAVLFWLYNRRGI